MSAWLSWQAHIYDVESLQCFTPSASDSHHVGGINQVRCAGDGKQYATAGKDGTVKLWDIVSSKCIATLDSAHDKMVRTSRSSVRGHTEQLSLSAGVAGGDERCIQQEPEVLVERRAQQRGCSMGLVRAAPTAVLQRTSPRQAPITGVLQPKRRLRHHIRRCQR